MVEPVRARIDLDVEAAYDRWSASYDSYDNPVAFMAAAALARGVPAVDGWTIVEFGCGTGRNLDALRRAGAGRLIGLDLSEGMLAKARDRGFTELLRHDMRDDVPLPARSVDGVLFALSLEHVADLRPPLREAARLLRLGGSVWIVEIHPFLSQGGAQAHFRDGAEEVHMPAYAHRFCDYLDAFRAAGLGVDLCIELRPLDLTGEPPAKVLKRGKEMPLVVMFSLSGTKASKAG
jgi:malonyl-CoA O-methyltransferase